MKKTFLPLILLFLVSGSLLSACSGGQVAESWSNMTLGPNNETVFLAAGPHIYEINLSNGTEKSRVPAKASKTTFYAPPALGEDGQLLIGGYDFIFYNLKPGAEQLNPIFSEAADRYVAGALVHSGNIYAPSSDGNLYALDASGNLRWKFEAESAIWGTPVLDGNTLYISSMDHRIYAIDADRGTLLWKSDDLGGAMVARPTLGPDGLLYVGFFGTKGDRLDKGSKLVAVDAANGAPRWNTPTKGWVFASPLLHEGVLYFGDTEGYFYAVSAVDGAVRWQIQPDTSSNRSISSAPVVIDDTVYFASKAGTLYAVKTSDGSMLWNKPIGGEIYTDLTLAGDMLLIAPIRAESALVAVDLNGNQKWAFAPAK
jgi:outer membrane protein assembly factor BamB